MNVSRKKRGGLPLGGTMRCRGNLFAGEPAFVLLAMLLIFLGSVEVLTIMLSLGRVVITQGMAITIAMGALLITAGYRLFLRSERLREIPDDEKGSGWSIGILVFLAMLVYVWLWIIAYALPDFSWDGLFYHGPTMHFWARKGYIHWIKIGPSSLQSPIDILWNGLPKGVELIGFIMVRATGLPRLLNAINLPFLLLGVLAVVSLSRTLGASTRWARMAGVLYIFIPINISLSATTYIDPGVASCYLALFALVGIVLARIKDGLLPWRLLPALGCGLGLSLAAKVPGIVLLPTVVILLALRIFRAGRRMPSPATDPHRSGNSSGVQPPTISSLRIFGKGGVYILIMLAVTFFVGGYWSARNYLQTGNPVYPANISVAGMTVFRGDQTLFPPPKVPGMEEWSQLKRVLFNWLEGLDNWRGAATSYSSWYGGLGLLWILGGLPSIMILLTRTGREYFARRQGRIGKSPGIGMGLAALSVMVLALFFAMPEGHSHIVRYTIWLYGIGLPCFVVVAGRAWIVRERFARWGGRLWVGACVIAIVLEGLYSLNYQTKRIFVYQSGEGSDTFSFSRIALSLQDRYPVGYYWGELRDTIFEDILADQGAVILGELKGRRKLILGHLSQGDAFGMRDILFLDQDTVESADKFKVFVKDHNIKYLIWDIEEPIPVILKEPAVLNEEAGGLFRVLVYNRALLPE